MCSAKAAVDERCEVIKWLQRQKILSDIAIRFDGLLLAAVLLGGALIFAVIAGAAMIRSLIAKPAARRSSRLISRSAWLAFGHVTTFAALIAYLSEVGAPLSGPDWLDWLAIPCLIFTASGLVLIFRSRAMSPTNDASDSLALK